jgi:FMN reductase
MSETLTIAGLGGSLASISRSRAALEVALEGAAGAGAKTVLLDVRELDLPLYNPDDEEPTASAARLIEACYGADGMLWSSPMYQGTISGAFKNALDWLHLLGDREPAFLHDKVIGARERGRRQAEAAGDQYDGVRNSRPQGVGRPLRRSRGDGGAGL